MEQESDEAFCRICLDNDDKDDLFSPCKCKGTSKFVHKKCLMMWIDENLDNKNSKICNQCLHEYEINKINTNKNNMCFCNFCYFISHYKIISGLINLGLLFLIGFITANTNIYIDLKNNFMDFSQFQYFSLLILGSFIYLIITGALLLLLFLLFFLGIIDIDYEFNYNEINFKKILLIHMWGLLIFYFFPVVSFTVTILIMGIDRIYFYEKVISNFITHPKYEILEYDIESLDFESENLVLERNDSLYFESENLVLERNDSLVLERNDSLVLERNNSLDLEAGV